MPLLEFGDGDIAVAPFQQLRLQALGLDDGPHQPEGEGRRRAFPQDAERHCRAGRAAHASDAVGDGHPAGRLAVDLPDVVSRQYPRLEGRRVLDGGVHQQFAVAAVQHDADAAEGAGHVHLHLGIVGFGQIAAVRVERGQHAVDGAGQKLLVVDLLHVAGLNDGDHLPEHAQIFGVASAGFSQLLQRRDEQQ